ncbi:MAG: hypothetical protein Q7J34_10805 [Bacteroidales bacterium]|nr:hypothetical protein [Bacteroidales bacterium]
MADWLDEAENKAKRGERSGSDSERIRIKKDRITENYIQIQKEYDSFVTEVLNLIERVNNLPEADRKGFGKLEGKRKDSKLNNHLLIFSSSRRIEGKPGSGILNYFFPKHVKHVRVIYLSVSKYPGKCSIEVKESFLERKRMRNDASNSSPRKDQEGYHHLLQIGVEELTHPFSRSLIDFLAFKKKIEELPLTIPLKKQE